MLVQSGKPVGVFRTNVWAPRVLIANSNLVGDWANWEQFRKLEAEGLTMYGQMTAGSWIYIGTQGILQGTYETFGRRSPSKQVRRHPGRHHHAHRRRRRHGRRAAAGGHHERGRRDLRRRATRRRIDRRIAKRYLDVKADDLDDAVDAWRSRREMPSGRCRSAWSATPPRSSPRCSSATRRSTSSPTRPRRTTRCPTCRSGIDFEDMKKMAEKDPAYFTEQAQESMAKQVAAMVGFLDKRRRGLRLRQLDPRRSPKGRLRPRLRLPRLRPGLHPAAVRGGPRSVPVGRPVRRPQGHRRHRQGDPRALPRQRAPATVDHHGR